MLVYMVVKLEMLLEANLHFPWYIMILFKQESDIYILDKKIVKLLRIGVGIESLKH